MARASIGHVHLLVRDVERSSAFYCDVLGLEVREVEPGRWAFLSSGTAHHELALSQLGPDAKSPDEDAVGLLHLAFDVPDKAAVAVITRRLLDRGVEIRPVDHRISWGVYFPDPDGNTLEVGCDTRGEPDGSALWEGENRPITVEDLLAFG